MIKLQDAAIDQILPLWLAEKPEVKALGYAIMKGNQRILQFLEQSMVYAGIDSLPEKILDVLAIELRSPYYENDMVIERKRTIIKNTLRLHAKLGTPSAVKEMIDYAFGEGGVSEWFEYGGEPFHFKISTDTVLSNDANEAFSKLIKKVKNTRSHLDGITIDRKVECNVFTAATQSSYSIPPVIICNSVER